MQIGGRGEAEVLQREGVLDRAQQGEVVVGDVADARALGVACLELRFPQALAKLAFELLGRPQEVVVLSRLAVLRKNVLERTGETH